MKTVCDGCTDCQSTTRPHVVERDPILAAFNSDSRAVSAAPVPGTDDPSGLGAAHSERTRRTSVSRREIRAQIAAERRREFADRGVLLLDDLTEIARDAGIEPPPTGAQDPTLAKADEIIHGPRQDKYGDPVETCGRIGEAWGAILGTGPLEARTVAWMMVALKAVRDVSGVSDLDNPVDAAGYCAIAGRALPQDAF